MSSLPSPREAKCSPEISLGIKQSQDFMLELKTRHLDADSGGLTDRSKTGTAEESDEDLLTVPDLGSPPLRTNSGKVSSNASGNYEENLLKRRRGRNPADKEYRRLKRLLRNRVSAQQARERKKAYVSELESRARDLHDINAKLEEKISTLINENNMLRKVLMNARPKAAERSEKKQEGIDCC